MSLTSLPELKQGGISVTQQLIIDAYGIIEKSRSLIRDFLDARTPNTITVAHVHGNFDEVNSHTKLRGNTICTGLESIEGEHTLFGCSFFDHSNELITFGVDRADMKRREGYLYQVVIIHKFLTEGFRGMIPNEIFMNDSFDPSQLQKLNNLGIVVELEANTFTDDRRVRLYKR